MGENNSYDDPGDQAIERVESYGEEVMGTIEDRTITIVTDGQTYEVVE
ncbi:hypothetical protein HXA32_03005 [Salipaludibacillus agaradhaerens]|nr:hypothetical protein [Salipaludibacillus agaradhaerens]MCR6105250.1 hypothetical protein [Salipaludibacillus agaradhaerens]